MSTVYSCYAMRFHKKANSNFTIMYEIGNYYYPIFQIGN